MKNRKLVSLLLVTLMLFYYTFSFCSVANVSAATKMTVKFSSIKANCRLSTYGKLVDSFTLKVNTTDGLSKLSTKDFQLKGCAITDGILSNDIKVIDIVFKDKTVILYVDPFYVELNKFSVICTNKALSFQSGNLTTIKCKQYDSFKDVSSNMNGVTLKYKMFTPKDTSKALPLVVYNHGGGCFEYGRQILDDPFSGSFVTDKVQEDYPCYVIAPFRASVLDPSISSDDEFAALKVAIDKLVASGKVDSKRIYMSGESAGSITTIKFANKYPGYLAAVALMNGGPLEGVDSEASLEKNEENNLATPWSDEELKTLANSGTSVMFVQGIGDPLSVPMRYATVYQKLMKYGMNPGKNLMWVSYTDQEFNFLIDDATTFTNPDMGTSVDPITGKVSFISYAFHSSSRAAAQDTTVKNWIMEQKLSK